jgi:RecA-family ATPase
MNPSCSCANPLDAEGCCIACGASALPRATTAAALDLALALGAASQSGARGSRGGWFQDADELRRDHLHTFTAEELTISPPPIPWVWEDLILRGKVAVLAGPGSKGKSSITTHLAIARALERSCFGRRALPGKTLIVSAEDSAHDYRLKFHAHLGIMPGCDAATRETVA